jgi:CRISPR-associated exonuclease Cas4
MKINGTLIQYYFHCKREFYLRYFGFKPLDTELVRVGKLLHKERDLLEMELDNIKIDNLKGNVLYEFKKRKSNEVGAYYQVLYYMHKLKNKNIPVKKGIIKFIENNRIKEVFLTKQSENELKNVLIEMEELILNGEIPKRQRLKRACRGCSYFDYCWTE